MLKHILRLNVLLIVLFILSCGKSGPISLSIDAKDNQPDRFANDFDTPEQLFSDSYDAETADIAEIIQGPGYINYTD